MKKLPMVLGGSPIANPPALKVPILGITLNNLNCELENMKKLGYKVEQEGPDKMYKLLNAKSVGAFGGAFCAGIGTSNNCDYVLKIQYKRPNGNIFINELRVNLYIQQHYPNIFSPTFIGGFECQSNNIIDTKLTSLGISDNCGYEKCTEVSYLLSKKFGKDLGKNNYLIISTITNKLSILNYMDNITVHELETIIANEFNILITTDPTSQNIVEDYNEFLKSVMNKSNSDPDIKKILNSILEKNKNILPLLQIDINNFLKFSQSFRNDNSLIESTKKLVENHWNTINNSSSYPEELLEVLYSSPFNANEFEKKLNKIIEFDINSKNKIEEINKNIENILNKYNTCPFYNIFIFLKQVKFLSFFNIFNGTSFLLDLQIKINHIINQINVPKLELNKFIEKIKNKRDGKININVIFNIFDKLNALHNSGIIHGDFGFRNILFETEQNGILNILFTDFGFSIIIDKDSKYYKIYEEIIIKNLDDHHGEIDINNYIILNKIYDYAEFIININIFNSSKILINFNSSDITNINNYINKIFVENLIISKLKKFKKGDKIICDFNLLQLENYLNIKGTFFNKFDDETRTNERIKLVRIITNTLTSLINTSGNLFYYIQDNFPNLKFDSVLINEFCTKFKIECM